MDQECAINMPHNNGTQKGKEKVDDNRDSGTSQGDSGQIHEDQVPSPSAPFFSGRNPGFGRNDYRARCGPLLQAIIKGDWPAAKAFLDEDPKCVRARITKEEGTALHAAVTAQRTSFIKELLKLMKSEDLELKTNDGYTALHSAADSGKVKIAEQLVKVNKKPLMILNNQKDVPLNVAAYVGHAEMVTYLFRMTDLGQLTPENRIELFHYTIYNELYDTGLEILKKYPDMATADSKCRREALEMLAKKPFAIGSESQLSFWKSLLKYSC